MTPTRLSKIARLPAKTREELNRRLHDGELSRTILPWVNSLPKTKKIMTELFNGKPITHQNLSEWRHTGYQDWLFHQQRIDWFHRLTEEEADIQKHDKCDDTFEAMSNYFLFELGQGVRALQTMKDPIERMERMQHLAREFARMQNAFNWSRRVQLEWDKANHRLEPVPSGTGVSPVRPRSSGTGVSPVSSCLHRQDSRATKQPTAPEHPEPGGASPSARTVPASRTPVGDDARSLKHPQIQPTLKHPNAGGASVPASRAPLETNAHEIIADSSPDPKRQGPGALQDAPRNPETSDSRASVLDCGSPLPLSEAMATTPTSKPEGATAPRNGFPSSSAFPNSQTPKPLNSLTPTECQPLPPLAPPTPPPRPFKVSHAPMRGRRFICIEG